MADGNQNGSDKPFYKSPGGVLFAPANLANGAGLGTPPQPGLRGKSPAVGSNPIPTAAPAGENGVIGQLLTNHKAGK